MTRTKVKFVVSGTGFFTKAVALLSRGPNLRVFWSVFSHFLYFALIRDNMEQTDFVLYLFDKVGSIGILRVDYL